MKEAGAESLSFQLLNRNVDLPLKYVATWLIDEWSKIGLHVTQRVCPTGPRFDAMRSGNFDVVREANGHGLANPPLDVQKYLPASVESENYGHYEDQKEKQARQTRSRPETARSIWFWRALKFTKRAAAARAGSQKRGRRSRPETARLIWLILH